MTELTLRTPTSFVEYLGSVPTIKILDFLIEGERDSWSMKEIAKHRFIAYQSVKKIMPQLLERELVVIGKTVGNIKLYRINAENKVVRKLMELEWLISKQAMDHELKIEQTLQH